MWCLERWKRCAWAKAARRWSITSAVISGFERSELSFSVVQIRPAACDEASPRGCPGYAWAMTGENRAAALPLFHLSGDPPDDQAFDFIHIERIASRAAVHDWTIRAHRHRNLFQILLIERGSGDMNFDAA